MVYRGAPLLQTGRWREEVKLWEGKGKNGYSEAKG